MLPHRQHVVAGARARVSDHERARRPTLQDGMIGGWGRGKRQGRYVSSMSSAEKLSAATHQHHHCLPKILPSIHAAHSRHTGHVMRLPGGCRRCHTGPATVCVCVVTGQEVQHAVTSSFRGNTATHAQPAANVRPAPHDILLETCYAELDGPGLTGPREGAERKCV